MVTLGVYLVGSGLTAATQAGGGWVVFLYATRIIAGAGIGGEYAAINSAIDEMIPARYRGRIDIAVNGTYWAGALIGTAATLFVTEQALPGLRLAVRLPDRSGARSGDHLRATEPAGEPALADHAWARAGGRGRHRRDRTRGRGQHGQQARAGRGRRGDRDPADRAASATSRCCARCSSSIRGARR